jgi:tetratricopeptide (TPR) repeat protein
LTAATLRLVEGLVQVTALGPVPVKGLEESVEVFELIGASDLRHRLQAAVARGLTPFVGRQQELEILYQALARVQTGHGQVVALVGDAGVGKSRLVYEMVHSHRTQGWLVLESASVSYGKATPYFPVIDLLKRYCHIDDGDDAHTIRAKVTGQVLTLDAMLQDTLPALLALLDALPDDHPFGHLEPPQRRQRTLAGLKRVLLRESQVQPVLLVCEDVHWIDSETQALLESLVESLPMARLLLLVTYRPEYQHGWGSKTYYTQLRLDPLPPASADALLQALLGNDPSLAPLTRLLIERTEGNPFFLEESVRTLVESGTLLGDPGACRLAHALPTIQVPSTVQAVLAARIDRVPPEEKHLLQTAAVIGMEVPFTLLQAVAERPEETLRLGLIHLQDAEFLYEASLFPDLAYTFKHALTQEVAYGSLLHERRRGLHARIVAALEALTPARVAEQVDRLAHHALRGEVWEKAMPYCQQAGARAWARAALREAVASFEQALQALTHLSEDGDTRVLAIELRLALAGALQSLGEYGRCLALVGEAEALTRVLDDRARLVRVLTVMANVLRITGNPNSAMAACQQALALAVELNDSALQMEVSYTLGQVYYTIGDFGRAAELLRRNREATDRESGTPSTDIRPPGPDEHTALFIHGQLFGVKWLRRSQAWLARTLSALGAFAEGRRHGEEALRLATLGGQWAIQIVTHSALGELYLAKGDLEQAIRVLEHGLALCRASGNRDTFRNVVADLGATYALQGRLAEGRALLEEGISESLCTGALSNLADRVAWLSEVWRLAGHWDEAWQHAHQALDLARHQKARGGEARALHQLGVVQAHATPPNVAQAEAHYRQALALANELGMRPLVAHCHRGLGTLYVTTGQWEQARTALSTAIALYRDMEMTFWLPQAEAALAQVEGQ